MINIYSPDEVEKIKKSAAVTAKALEALKKAAVVGISTLELDQLAEKIIRESGGEPSFMMEPGYKYTTCMNVNDMVVHGIPSDYKLQDGDRLGIDVGTFVDGFHSDASWSVQIGQSEPDTTSFLQVGQKALEEAIKVCLVGNHVGHISQKMQTIVEAAGFSCVRQLVGHGVGRKLHEDPEVPCYLRGEVENTPKLTPGMVLAVEVIYNQGQAQIVYLNDDGWTIVTKDFSLSGLFEHTVAITAEGPQILTL